jgi:transcriptional regulator with XRE-family HTH domain
MTLFRRGSARFERAALPHDEPATSLRPRCFAASIVKRGPDRQRAGNGGSGMSMGRQSVEQIIGQRIRARRTELGLIQEELGAAVGLSYQQIQKYENGTNRITVARLLALAERLEVPVAYFLAGLDAPIAEAMDARGAIRDDRVRLAVASLVRAVAEREA